MSQQRPQPESGGKLPWSHLARAAGSGTDAPSLLPNGKMLSAMLRPHWLISKDLDGCYKQGLAFEGSAEC